MKTLLFLLLQYNLSQVAGYTFPSVHQVPSLKRQRSTNLFATTNNHGDEYSNNLSSFNPLNLSEDEWSNQNSKQTLHNQLTSNNNNNNNEATTTLSTFTKVPLAVAAITTLTSSSTAMVEKAYAAVPQFSSGAFNPDNFRPVCPTSDSIYRIAQGTTQSLVGAENFIEYGPLIAGGLLRVRLELCVVESFFNEAVGPFIEKEGLGWILPLHETVETFLAGTIFALASTFILVGSTKIISVLVTYADVFFGSPLRLFGGFAFDRARGKPVTLDIGVGPFKKRVIGPGTPKDDLNNEETLEEIFDFSKIEKKDLPIALFSGAAKGVGETSKFTREVLESVDLFVGRYLTLIATGYIGLKFVHFKIFPDFPPF